MILGVTLISLFGSALFFQLIERFAERQHYMGRRRESPFSILFHSLPLIIKIQRKASCFTLAFHQLISSANNERKSWYALNTFIGAADDEVNSQLSYLNVYTAKA